MIFFNKKEQTATRAKERLQNLLISDDLKCSEELLNELEKDIHHSISKYFSILSPNIKTRVLKKEHSNKNEFLLVFEAEVIK